MRARSLLRALLVRLTQAVCLRVQLRALCVHHIQKTFRLVERTDEWAALPEELRQLVFGTQPRDGSGFDED